MLSNHFDQANGLVLSSIGTEDAGWQLHSFALFTCDNCKYLRSIYGICQLPTLDKKNSAKDT